MNRLAIILSRFMDATRTNCAINRREQQVEGNSHKKNVSILGADCGKLYQSQLMRGTLGHLGRGPNSYFGLGEKFFGLKGSPLATWDGRRRSFGFTLVEIVGVLGILAILAALASTNAFKRMDEAVRTREKGDLNTLSNAFVRTILDNKSIPVVGGMSLAMAQELTLPNAAVSVNSRRYGRVFWVDPTLQINGGGLPYTQTRLGASAKPVNMRGMIISSINQALPVGINTGIPTSNDFVNAWSTAAGAKPALAIWNGWSGRGEDLFFQRVDLAPLFHRVILRNADPTGIARYSIDDNPADGIGVNSEFSAWYLDGTVVNLRYATAPNYIVQFRQVLHRDESFIFQNGRWDTGFTSPTDENGDFAYWVSLFLQPPAPPSPKFNSTQQSVINEFYDFLLYYANWGFGTPPLIPPFQGVGGPNAVQYPAYAVLNGSQVTLDKSTYCLIH